MKEMSLSEIKSVQLSILDSIDGFCKKNNIHYYLYAGTLIGAVRHNGYIPWDDDVDVCMNRKDYDFFFNHFVDEQNEKIAICFENTKGYYLASGKVIDQRTVMYESTSHSFPIGVYVDVFPMDLLPDNVQRIRNLDKRISVYRKMLILKNLAVMHERAWYKDAIVRVGRMILKPISFLFILKRIRELAVSYNENKTCTRIADISVFTYGLKEVHFLHEFETAIDLVFEGKKYKAPCGYDNILRRMYGDYMMLPPVEKRVSHHSYKVFWKHE